jgi:hypothetical protein
MDFENYRGLVCRFDVTHQGFKFKFARPPSANKLKGLVLGDTRTMPVLYDLSSILTLHCIDLF